MELKVSYRFDSPLPPFLIWHDPVIFNEELRKGYSNRLYKISARSTDIPESLRKSAKTDAKNEFRELENPSLPKNKNCCKMLQNVARCCKSLYLGTRISHSLKNQRIEIFVPKLP